MKKTEFIKAVSQKALCTQKTAGEVLSAIIETVKDELKSDGGESRVPGMGTFKIVVRKEKKCRNPQDGETVISPEHPVVRFKVIKGF